MKQAYVYLMQCDRLYKIGRSKNPESRASTLDNGPAPVVLVHKIATDDAVWLENLFHCQFAARRVRGEWFTLTEADVAELLNLETCNRMASLTLPLRGEWRREAVKRAPAIRPYLWKMEPAIRHRLNERCKLTGRTLKEELTEAALYWLETEPSLSAKARASQGQPKRKRKDA